MDIQKQIEYWRIGSQEDMEAAEILLEKGRYRHALFFAHLALEKALKAHVTRKVGEMPPKIHNLIRLASIAGIVLDSERTAFLSALNLYSLEGRYPDIAQVKVDKAAGEERIIRAKELANWLTGQL